MKLRITLFNLFLLIAVISAQGQVTIGLDEAPVEGAILQLKTENSTVLASNGNVTAYKGLGLPRVNLVADKANYTAGDTDNTRLATSLGLTINAEASKHIGLMIFNMREANIEDDAVAAFTETKICKGIYVWMGDKWARAMVTPCP
ncbi:MAG: hypothetical protein E6767_02055 [Dysgonomonas sp.]|nr:hypothetical protein [Dysgonomonas sp.]